jgi:glycosyltransferase involved in cell wall biosynthesis
MIHRIENPHRVTSAEIVIGVPSYNEASSISFPVAQSSLGLEKYFHDRSAVIINADNHSEDNTRDVFFDTETEIPKIYVTTDEGVKGKGVNVRNILRVSVELDAKAIIILDADLKSIQPRWVENFLEPIFDGYDFVVPIYSRHKYDGTITNTIAYPLLRTLYGVRVRQPIAGDFGISGRLARCLLVEKTWTEYVYQFGIDIWMTTVTICRNFSVCQTLLGCSKNHKPKDPSNLGNMFSQVVGTIFQLMSDFDFIWKDVHKSRPSTVYGFGLGQKESYPEITVDREALYSAFMSGFDKYSEIWERVLSAENLGLINKLRNLDPIDFLYPSGSWGRMLFEFAVAYRLGEVDTNALIEALVPLYHSRTLAFINGTADMDTEAAEEYEEWLNRGFEAQKPYLVKIWDQSLRENAFAQLHHLLMNSKSDA